MLKRPRENVEQVMEIVLVKGNKGWYRLWSSSNSFCSDLNIERAFIVKNASYRILTFVLFN